MSLLNFVCFLIKLCFDSDAHERKIVTFSKEIRIWVKKMFSRPKKHHRLHSVIVRQ